MKTIKTVVYDFDELSEEAKQNAISNLSDININHKWWEFTYDDAENIGLRITGFDVGRGCYVDGELIHSVKRCCELIMENHGASCETYILANRVLDDLAKLLEQDLDESEYNDLCEENEDDFLRDLCDCYLTILRDEYEYRTSDEEIIETIQANEYTFLPDGTMKNY